MGRNSSIGATFSVRMSRCFRWLVFGCLASSACLVPAADARERCGRSGEQVVEQSAQAKVVKRGSRVFACSTRTGERRLLRDAVAPFRIQGRFVAYAMRVNTGSSEGINYFVRVYDTKRARWTVASDAYTPQMRNDGEARVTDLEVSREGGLAWIVLSPRDGPQVHALRAQADGPLSNAWQPIDSAAGIWLKSLALSNGIIYWTRDGMPQSMRFSDIT
jgi:hypothetical protein